MPAVNLVILAFRFALTLENQNSIARSPNVHKIRDLKNNSDFKDRIISIYQTQLPKILAEVDQMISGDDNDKSPSILKLDIYKNHADIVLLLMYLAYRKNTLDKTFIRAFTFYILWFSAKGKESDVTKEIFNHIWKKDIINSADILKGLLGSVYNNWIKPIVIVDRQMDFSNLENTREQLINYFKYNESVLIFAQRRFINDTFPNFKPISSFDWDQHNRPWDIDHIIPRSWLESRGGTYKAQCMDYIGSIGNLAAIPFEVNREKNAREDWNYYCQYKDVLLFEKEEINGINNNFKESKEGAEKFVQFCKARMNRIVSDCNIAIFRHVNLQIPLPDNIDLLPDYTIKRKFFFEELKKNDHFKDYILYYVDEDTKKEIPIDGTSVLDWSRRWLSLGHIIDGFMISITSLNGEAYEIGLRKLPTEQSTNPKILTLIEARIKNSTMSNDVLANNPWWYAMKVVKKDVLNEVLNFVEEFEKQN